MKIDSHEINFHPSQNQSCKRDIARQPRGPLVHKVVESVAEYAMGCGNECVLEEQFPKAFVRISDCKKMRRTSSACFFVGLGGDWE